MSQEIGLPIDRAQRRQQNLQSDYYVRDRSPKRSSSELVQSVACRNYGGGGEDRNGQCISPQGNPPLYLQNSPGEFLDDFEEPSFGSLVINSTFEEIMCILATPPQANQRSPPTAAQKSDELDDLRKRIAAHIGNSADNQELSSEQVADVRKRVATVIEENAQGPPICPYKIPPLSEDLYDIPPPPKNPKDVVAIIRRAQAIERLKAHEDAKAASKPQKNAVNKKVRDITAPKKRTKQVPALLKPKPGAATKYLKQVASQKTGAIPKKKIKQPQHPPDYVSDEWAAAILRARRLSGLKTTNPKLLPKPKKPLPPVPKSPLQCPATTKPKTPTLASILERVATIKTANNNAKEVIMKRRENIATTTPQDELDEFEVLEELYDAGRPYQEQYANNTESAMDLQSRITALQQQLLQSPPHVQQMSDELDEFEALELQCGAQPNRECPATQYTETNWQNRMNALQKQLLKYPGIQSNKKTSAKTKDKFDDAVLHGINVPEFDISEVPEFAFSAQALADAGFEFESEVPKRSRSPAAVPMSTKAKFNDAFLHGINVPEFDISEVPEFAFSAQAQADAGFEFESEVPKRSRSPAAVPMSTKAKFNDAFLHGINVPEFDISEVPEFAFSAQALADAGFEFESEVPKRSRSPAAVPMSTKAKFNDAFLHGINVPEFDISEVPEFAFSAQAQADAGFEFESEVPKRCRAPVAVPMSTKAKFDDAILHGINVPEFDISEVPEFAFSAQAMADAGFEIESEIPQRCRPPVAVPISRKAKFDDAILHGINVPEFDISEVPEFAFSAQALADAGFEIESEVPKRSRSPVAVSMTTKAKFNDAFLQGINIPEFDINEVPEFAFSAEALADAGFEIGSPESLGDISLPALDEDISFDEQGLADITSPDLCDLSTSGDNLALEPDYPLEITTEEDEDVVTKQMEEDITKQPGFLTAMINSITNGVRNIFSSSRTEDEHNDGEETDLDSSLPNMFETTSPQKTPEKVKEKPIAQRPLTPICPARIPPHPKDPKDYIAMVKRSRAIQKKKAEEAAKAEVPIAPSKGGKRKREIKSTIPKRAVPTTKKISTQKKKNEKQKKVYPPGEYSPSDRKQVARARSLAGLKNLSALLNPEREARIAAREAELAALPPAERMREKMKTIRHLPRPSSEALATLEAIRASLPQPKPAKRKWRPAGRLRVDRRVKPSERIFRHEFGRVLIPNERTQRKKGWKELDVMSPILEQSHSKDEHFIQFSPLNLREGQLRLRYLKEQAAKRATEAIRAAEEKQEAMLFENSPSHHTTDTSQYQFSPIQLGDPTSPRTEETRHEKVITKIGPHGGTETIREEITETSTIENGEVHTSTKQVTTKTDEYGNVTCHIEEDTGSPREEESIPEDLYDIEPPDFSELSDMPPRDPSIPTTAEIIRQIQSKVQEQLNSAFLDVLPDSPSPASPAMIDFPQDITEEELYDIEAPEFEKTPQKASPQLQMLSPIVKDQRMYAWGELPPATPTPRIPTPKVPEPVKYISPLPKQKPQEEEKDICIPPHPKDPKDYEAMVKRARLIHKLKKQQEDLAAKAPTKPKRVPISRWREPPQGASRKPQRQRLVLKKRVPKVSPKQTGQQKDEEDSVCPSEPPPLPQKYREAVARARLLRGLKNRTAALNPAVAEKQAALEAAQAAFDALPEVEKIKIRLEKLRKIPAKARRFELSADMIGTLEGIRANMPPLQEVIQQPIQTMSPQTPICTYPPVKTPQGPVRHRARSPGTSPSRALNEYMDSYKGKMPALEDSSLDEFETLEAEAQKFYEYNIPLMEERLEAEAQHLYASSMPAVEERPIKRQLTYELPPSPPGLSIRKLAEQGYFQMQDQEMQFMPKHLQETYQRLQEAQEQEHEQEMSSLSLSEESSVIHIDESTERPIPDVLEDFRVPTENIILETSQLMPETPPKNIQERFQRLKEAQKKQILCTGYSEQFNEPVTPTTYYSPIKIRSPEDAPRTLVGEHEQQMPPISLSEENLLIHIDESAERQIAAVKQFRDLEDMPFDELEFEIEPSVADISMEKPLSPAPRPSDIIRAIESRVHMEMKNRARLSPAVSPGMINLPVNLPDEELFELSAPSFPQTPKTPQARYKSPRVSLPMAWGEVRPATPVTPATAQTSHNRVPTPTRTPTNNLASHSPKETIKDRIPTPEGPIAIPPHPKDPKDYAAMIRRARAIHKLKQKESEEAAKAPPPEPSKKLRVPISRWTGAPLRKTSAKPRKKLVLRKRAQKPIEEGERECPTEPPPLSQEYRDAVARARLIHGLKNRTAALNPKIAAKKAAKEAAEAAYNALPEFEKIKVRLARLRKKPFYQRGIKPTLEQIAYLQALKRNAEQQCPSPAPLQNRINDLEQQLLEEFLQIDDASLAEFEAIEALEAQLDQHPAQPGTPLDLHKRISELQRKLETPPRIDPRERYRQLLAQRRIPTTPIASPVKIPEIRVSPITLPLTPTQISRDRTAHLASVDDLEDIEEPSFFDNTPLSPMERPRPRDLIDRVHRKMQRREVPTGHLIELRTPPRTLKWPEGVTEEELRDFSCPAFERTPSPARSPRRSPGRSPDISIPQIFVTSPTPPTPTPPPVPPLKRRVPSPEGPIVIPPHPRDPEDYKSICRRARKIQQLISQKRAAEEAEAAAAAIEAAKPKKKERVPISRRTAPPLSKHKKLKKKQMPSKQAECPKEPPPLPAHFAKEVAYSRILAGLKNRTAALNPKVAAREAAKAEAIRKAKETEAAKLAAQNAPPRSPLKDYAAVLERMKEIQEKGATARGQPSLETFAYLDALKNAMQVRQEQHQPVTTRESPKTRYERIVAARSVLPPSIEEGIIETPSCEDIHYSPISLDSPRLGDNQTDLAELINQYDEAAFEGLSELEDLYEFEQPSYMNVSQYPFNEDQHALLTPTYTPPPAPSAIIGRIRRQYEQEKAAASRVFQTSSPVALEFPEELTEEELFEISTPSLAQSPIHVESPIKSPNITIPHYFRESPLPARNLTPVQSPSPQLLGVFPGIKVKTPQGAIRIPPHPKDPADVVAMIRRSQIIQKMLAREAAERAAAAKAPKLRVPISRRIPSRPAPKLMRKLVLEKKVPNTKAKGAIPRPAKECPAEPRKLADKYLAEVAKARRMAGLKSKSALLNPKVAAKQLEKPKTPVANVPPKVTPPPPSYATIMERVAAIRAAKQKMQPGPSARQLTHRQHLINRQQRQERKRLLQKLDRLRQQACVFEPITPPPPQERLEAIKSRNLNITPVSSTYPYSPVKTPEVVDIPHYEPLALPQTPPQEVLDDVSISEIQNMSMEFDDLDNYTLDSETNEDLEFQIAEAAAGAIPQLDENNTTERANDFDIAKRIEMLQGQLLESSHRADAAVLEEYNIADRIENLQRQLQESIQDQLTSQEPIDGPQFEDEEQSDQQNVYDDLMDDFEAMERDCM